MLLSKSRLSIRYVECHGFHQSEVVEEDGSKICGLNAGREACVAAWPLKVLQARAQ